MVAHCLCELSALLDTWRRWIYLITQARDVPAYQWHCQLSLFLFLPPTLPEEKCLPFNVINDSTRGIIYYGSITAKQSKNKSNLFCCAFLCSPWIQQLLKILPLRRSTSYLHNICTCRYTGGWRLQERDGSGQTEWGYGKGYFHQALLQFSCGLLH